MELWMNSGKFCGHACQAQNIESKKIVFIEVTYCPIFLQSYNELDSITVSIIEMMLAYFIS